MSKIIPVAVLVLALFVCAPAFAIDGQILINQATVTAAGGFPYNITQAGSYKLSGNLVVTAEHTDAIDISTSNVTLDLNGFSITGPVNGAAGYGISASNTSSTGITIKNGVVSGFSTGVAITNGIVEGIQATYNSDLGIFVGAGLAKGNVALYNIGGIQVGYGAATGNFSGENSSFGLFMTSGLYGSNVFIGNGGADILNSGTAVSQNNNSCSNNKVC